MDVCLNSGLVTVTCAYERCHKPFQKRATNSRKVFCCTKCRVYASRAPRLARRNRWTAARRKYKTMEFDGRVCGPINRVGPLALFEVSGPRHSNAE
jgi:hypothetical protein